MFSSPHGQPRKCWVILGDIFNGVQETCPSCILHLLISVMCADNHPRVSKLRIFEGIAYEVSAPSQLQGGPTGSNLIFCGVCRWLFCGVLTLFGCSVLLK